jgi:hypothetical protein
LANPRYAFAMHPCVSVFDLERTWLFDKLLLLSKPGFPFAN